MVNPHVYLGYGRASLPRLDRRWRNIDEPLLLWLGSGQSKLFSSSYSLAMAAACWGFFSKPRSWQILDGVIALDMWADWLKLLLM